MPAGDGASVGAVTARECTGRRPGTQFADGRPASAAVMLAIVAVGLCVPTSGRAAPVATPIADPFLQEEPSVTVDWRRGFIEAVGGAAADHRMPSADVARVGAERRANADARGRLAAALLALPLGGGRHLDQEEAARAVARARTKSVDYQSNGGALVRLVAEFGDWHDGPLAATTAPADQRPLLADPRSGGTAGVVGTSGGDPREVFPLFVPECSLNAAPVIVAGGRELVVLAARYAPAASLPPGRNVVRAHADKKGRLVLPDTQSGAELAGRVVLVYVGRVLR